MTNRSKMWLKPTDQMDLWLETQGYYRKHTARDGTCLFRAVAEQLGLTQHYHLELRRQCVDYVLLFEDLFKDKLTCSLKEYEDRMRITTEWGGEFELDVISRIYKCDFLLFREVGQPAENITDRGYDEKIILCVSQEKHYDSVFTKQHISNTAYCQSLVYEQLYKRAFGLVEVDFAVKKMLHDKAPRYQRDPCMSVNGMALRLEMRDTCLNVKELLLLGVTPFPYKVAKSLDPEIYRNVEYDTWNDYRKGLRYGSRFWTSNELCVGVKCLVKLENDKNFHGFIQEMEPDKGPVLVFIEELGEKMSVPYECLELLPQPQPNVSLSTGKQLRQLQAVKLALHAQPDSTTQTLKKTQKNSNRQKCKELHEIENRRKNANSCDSTNDQQSLQSSNYLASASSDCYEHELDYQQEMHDNYQHAHLYPTQSCEVTSSSMDPEGDQGVVNMSSCPPVSHYAANANPNHLYQIPASNNPAYCAVNFVPTRSVHPDGSDLPMADLPTLRYYYNIGLDYMRMNYVVQPPTRPTTTHCYPMIQSPTQYITDSVPVSYVSYEQPQPVPAVYPEAMPVALVRPPVPVSTGVSSTANEPDSTSCLSPSRNQSVAPRFKNKRKNEHQTACASPPQSNTTQQPALASNDIRHRNQNVVQQPLTTPSPSPAPSHIPAVPSHFVPVQPSYSPTAAMVPPTVYYHPVECDRNYCTAATTAAGYYDYTLYDIPTSAVYPTTIYSPQTTVPQTSYLTTDGVYYQPYVQPAAVEY